MKANIKIVLLIVFSFLLGIYIPGGGLPILLFEARMLADILNTGNSLLNQLNIVFLVVFHLATIWLLFLKPGKFYKTYLIVVPAAFLLFYVTNMIMFILISPWFLISMIPFIVMWILCLAVKNKSAEKLGGVVPA